MEISKCKRCGDNDLKRIENYPYQFEEEPIVNSTVIICNHCECLHLLEEGVLSSYEFTPYEIKESKAVSGYAMSNHAK